VMTVGIMMNGLEVEELRPLMLARIATFSALEREELLASQHRPELVELAIELYAGVGDFRRSERVAQTVILPKCGMFNAQHVRQILEAAEQNVDIYAASGSPAVFVEMFERTRDLHSGTRTSWQRFMAKMMLGKQGDEHYSYPALRAEMVSVGMWPVPGSK
jgi:hypothetical protein